MPRPPKFFFRKVVSMTVPGRNCPDDDVLHDWQLEFTVVGRWPTDYAFARPRSSCHASQVRLYLKRVFLRTSPENIAMLNQLQSRIAAMAKESGAN